MIPYATMNTWKLELKSSKNISHKSSQIRARPAHEILQNNNERKCKSLKKHSINQYIMIMDYKILLLKCQFSENYPINLIIPLKIPADRERERSKEVEWPKQF